MMFLIKSPSPPMPESITTLVPVNSVVTQEAASPRPDYDLRPLIVRGLDHYLESEDSVCRFHIR